MEHTERLPAGAAKEKMNSSKDDVRTKRWATLSISSIPLVMTLGNSMLI